MIEYKVRSRQLMDIIGEIKRKKLIISPYFQRNLVWRTVHKVDFIKTILLGYPFPEIFLANGDLDIEEMSATSAVVDGQQRLNSIIEYLNDEFKVDNKYYSEQIPEKKQQFLKYEIAVIELDIKYDDPQIKEIFKRLNRTFYSLSNIEKLSSEFAPSEFMLVAKLLCNELEISKEDDEDNEHDFDPNTPEDFVEWAKRQNVGYINRLIVESPIFSAYEISRQVHLMFTLNIIGTIVADFFNRNIKKDLLNTYSNEFPEKDMIVSKLNNIAKKINRMKLPRSSYWYNKANMFSLIIALYNNYSDVQNIDDSSLKKALQAFAKNVPSDYQIAAKEGVNNKKERLIRNKYIENVIEEIKKA